MEHLQTGIKHVLTELVPLSNLSPYQNMWWTEELSELRLEFNRAQRALYKGDHNHPSWGFMRSAANKYHSAIRRQKRRHWRAYIDELAPNQLWDAARYISGKSTGSPRIPTLRGGNGDASSPHDKYELLFSTFFPTAPERPSSPLVSNPLPPIQPTITLKDFHLSDITKAINRLSPFKAPRPSGIPNIAIKSASSFLSLLLLIILDRSIHLGYFPRSWRQYSTVTLRKPGKRDYTRAKAYRPVVLEETLGKVVESVMARRLSELAEVHKLLPSMHFGGRPGRTTSDALLTLVQAIKDAWRRGNIATMLVMDISQVFPSVSHDKIRVEMHNIGLPTQLINWVQAFLSNRSTTLSFDDFKSEPRNMDRGLPQGSPLSPILYLIYSAGLLTLSTNPQNRPLVSLMTPAS